MSRTWTSSVVGRERELAAVDELITSIGSSKVRILLVEGSLGSGRSTLMRHVVRVARAHGCCVLRGTGSPDVSTYSFGVLRDALGAPWGIVDDDITEQPGLQRALDMHASGAPVVVIVDDAHWADLESVEALVSFASAPGRPVLLVLAERPGGPCSGLPVLQRQLASGVARRLALGPLSLPTVTAMVQRRVGGGVLGDDDVRTLHAVTRGVPLFLAAMLSEHEGGDLTSSLSGGSRTIARRVAIELQELDELHAEVIVAVAVLGGPVDAAFLSQVCSAAPALVEAAADDLVARGILSKRGQDVQYVAPVVGASVLATAPPGRRSSIRRRAAEVLADGDGSDLQVAQQLMGCELTGDPWTSERLLAGAREAAMSGRLELAADILERLLAEPLIDRVRRAQLEQELWGIELKIPRPSVVDRVRCAYECASDIDEAAALVVRLADYSSAFTGDHAAALAAIQAEIENGRIGRQAASAADLHLARWTYAQRCGASWSLLAQRPGDSCGHGSTATPDQQFVHDVLSATECLRRSRPCAEATVHLDAAAASLTDPSSVSVSQLSTFLGALVDGERWDEAQAHSDRALQRGLAEHHPLLAAEALRHRARVQWRRGDLAGAESSARSSLAQADSFVGVASSSLALLVHVLVERGSLDEAAQMLEVSTREPKYDWGADLLDARATYLLATGDAQGARTASQEAGAIRRQIGIRNPALAMRPGVEVVAALRSGDHEQAVRLADEALVLGEAFGTARARGIGHHLVGLTEGTIDVLEEAGELFGLAGSPLDQAQSLVDLGAALRRTNRREAARQPLREALDLASTCGSARLERIARAELAMSGASRPADRSGASRRLTPSEHRVCELALNGLTNVQIANALTLKVKTIEGHLRNSYHKLGIQGRRQLPQAMEAYEDA